jgi:hypothetical protein
MRGNDSSNNPILISDNTQLHDLLARLGLSIPQLGNHSSYQQ